MSTDCSRSFPPSPRADIVRVTDEERTHALSRLLGTARHDADALRVRTFLEHARDHSIPLDALYIRRGASRTEAAALIIPGAGRTALLFLSQPRSGDEPSDIGTDLVAQACAESVPDGVLVQVLLEPGASTCERWLPGAGFRFLAELSYLERPLSPRRVPAEPIWPPAVTATAWDPAQRDELKSLLMATYEATLDCPGLRGLRTATDILEGHIAAGRFDPAFWTILREGDAPIGACLISPAHSGDGAELIYLGLIPKARGRGLGRALLRASLRLITRPPLRTINLAVDDANQPASELYIHEGFRRVARRRAWVRPPTGCAPTSD